MQQRTEVQPNALATDGLPGTGTCEKVPSSAEKCGKLLRFVVSGRFRTHQDLDASPPCVSDPPCVMGNGSGSLSGACKPQPALLQRATAQKLSYRLDKESLPDGLDPYNFFDCVILHGAVVLRTTVTFGLPVEIVAGSRPYGLDVPGSCCRTTPGVRGTSYSSSCSTNA